MKQIWMTVAWLVVVQCCFSQKPVFQSRFGNNAELKTVMGIDGQRALDLTESNPERKALRFPVIANQGRDFTISVWVRADQRSRMAYTIVSDLEKSKAGYTGWKLSEQSSGAWAFSVEQGKKKYVYRPTPVQTIRDGRWHLLTVTFKGTNDNLRFYYDGKLKGIYYAWGVRNAFAVDTLMIGNSIADPHLFHTYNGVTTDDTEWDTFFGQIGTVSIFDRAWPAQRVYKYYTKVTGRQVAGPDSHKTGNTIKVMTFNIWHGANETGKETGMIRLITLLKEAQADVYTFVETYGSVERIADALGYYFYLISDNLSIVSRYPITRTYQVYHSFKCGGARIGLPDGRQMDVFAVWLNYLPNYHKGFPRHQWNTVADYLTEEKRTRGYDIRHIMQGIDSVTNKDISVPIILAGDFNCGSHLDWTERTKEEHFGYVIPWPASERVMKSGFTDSYRAKHPDPLSDPGITWSTVDHGPKEKYQYDRMDYIYYKGKQLKVLESAVINDGGLTKFPSDHAAVTTVFKWLHPPP